MKKTIFQIYLLLIVFSVNTIIIAQAIPGTLNWYNGEGAGMQTDKAYGLLKKKTSTPVIVAVIDSGVDIEHEDLQGKIWVNTKEIPKNGIDDDRVSFMCMFLTCIWVSQLRDEDITYVELMEMLGIEDLAPGAEKFYELDNKYLNLTHIELLEEAVTHFDPDED